MEFLICSGKGLAVLIINSTFDSHLKLESRPGAKRDLENMTEMFGRLNYKTECIVDATKDELEEKLKEITRKENLEGVECLVCVISTHGKEEEVKMTDQLDSIKQYEHWICLKDGRVRTDGVLHYFDCQNFKDKPKLVFIQSCRNRSDDLSTALDRGHEVVIEDSNDTSQEPPSKSASRMDVKDMKPRSVVVLPPQVSSTPSRDDVSLAAAISSPTSSRPSTPVGTSMPLCRNNFLIMSSCIPSAVGWSDDYKGGWLIYNLYDVFMSKINLKEKFGLIPALTEVACRVSCLCESDKKKFNNQSCSYKCAPMLEHRLTQEVYLIGN